MAKQTFEKGQRVRVYSWKSGGYYGEEHWNEALVEEPVGHAAWSGWSNSYKVGEPERGKSSYVQVRQFQGNGTLESYARWAVNAKNRILSLEDYEPKQQAQEARARAQEEHKAKQEDLERSRLTELARHITRQAAGVDSVGRVYNALVLYFNVKESGRAFADSLLKSEAR